MANSAVSRDIQTRSPSPLGMPSFSTSSGGAVTSFLNCLHVLVGQGSTESVLKASFHLSLLGEKGLTLYTDPAETELDWSYTI